MQIVKKVARLTATVLGAGALVAGGTAIAAPGASAAIAVNRLTVTESASGLTGLPATLSAGEYDVKFSTSAPSTQGVFFQFIRLRAGYGREQMLSDLLADFTGNSTEAQRVRLYARAVFSGGSGDPADRFATYLTPGRYVVGDFAAGHFQDLTVTADGGSTSGRVPSPSGEITAIQDGSGMFNFAVSGTLRHDAPLRFSNSTDQPHFLFVAKLAAGATAKRCILAGKGCQPQYDSGAISKDHAEVIPAAAMHLTPGRYAIACFIPEAHTGTPHAFMGMYREITVH